MSAWDPTWGPPPQTQQVWICGGYLSVTNTVSIVGGGGATVPTQTVTIVGVVPVSLGQTVAVAGTFFPATQPVSVAQTVAVAGAFFQATQPVSVAQTVAVVGAFYQPTQPVSITQTVTITGKVREDSVPMTWASVKSAAPAANALQATTGALSAGNYDFDINLVCSDTVAVGKGLVIEHRSAADTATLQILGGASPNGDGASVRLRNYAIATNERIRVIAGTAAGAASSMYISAIGRRLS